MLFRYIILSKNAKSIFANLLFIFNTSARKDIFLQTYTATACIIKEILKFLFILLCVYNIDIFWLCLEAYVLSFLYKKYYIRRYWLKTIKIKGKILSENERYYCLKQYQKFVFFLNLNTTYLLIPFVRQYWVWFKIVGFKIKQK